MYLRVAICPAVRRRPQASNFGEVGLAFQRQRRALKLAGFVAVARVRPAHILSRSRAHVVPVMGPIYRFGNCAWGLALPPASRQRRRVTDVLRRHTHRGHEATREASTRRATLPHATYASPALDTQNKIDFCRCREQTHVQRLARAQVKIQQTRFQPERGKALPLGSVPGLLNAKLHTRGCAPRRPAQSQRRAK